MGLSKLYIKTILIVVIYYDENETRFDCIALGNHCNYDKICILQIVTNIGVVRCGANVFYIWTYLNNRQQNKQELIFAESKHTWE